MTIVDDNIIVHLVGELYGLRQRSIIFITMSGNEGIMAT
jgi:hypothetical protein